MTLPLFVSPDLLDIRDACLKLMDAEPKAYPTLRSAWLDITYEDRLSADDHKWLALLDLRAAQRRKLLGRIEHAGPERAPRKIAARKARSAPPRLRRRVLALYPWCAYCEAPATEVDHIWPHSDDGSNDITNLAPICRRCNSSKRDKTVPEWIEWKKRREGGAPPAPQPVLPPGRPAWSKSAGPVPLPRRPRKVTTIESGDRI